MPSPLNEPSETQDAKRERETEEPSSAHSDSTPEESAPARDDSSASPAENNAENPSASRTEDDSSTDVGDEPITARPPVASGDRPPSGENSLPDPRSIYDRMLSGSKPFGLRATSSTDSERLIEQFYMLLESTFTRILDRGDPRVERYAGTVEHVRKILDRTPLTWRGAYQVEQLLSVLYSDAELRVEIERRLVDAKELLGSDVYQACRTEWESLQQDAAEARREGCEVLYNRLLNDLQWRYEVRQLAREHQHNATIKTGLLFIAAVFLFLPTVLIGPDFFTYVLQNPNTPVESQSFVYLADHLFTSLTAGLLGATFSMLTGLRRRLDETSFKDLRTLSTWGYVLTRGAIGLGAALIAYYFMAAELLQSGVFPSFDEVGEVTGTQGDSLLVVWCFVAGFSEKLVPNLLSSTADRAQSSAGGPQDGS